MARKGPLHVSICLHETDETSFRVKIVIFRTQCLSGKLPIQYLHDTLAYLLYICMKLIHQHNKLYISKPFFNSLRPRATHICINELTIIGSDNDLSSGWHQAIIWTNAGILLIQTLGTNFSEVLSEIHALSFKKMHLKMLSVKWRQFCLGLNLLRATVYIKWLRLIVTDLGHHRFR